MSKRLFSAVRFGLMSLCLLGGSSHSLAQNVLPRVVDEQNSEKAIAVVESVNVENRVVTLRALGRDQVTVMQVGDEVRNLAQVKVGDRVIVEYHEALAIDLVKGGGLQATTNSAAAAARAAEGEKPGMGAGEVIELVATIVGIDPDEPSVRLMGPKGNVVEVLVRDPAKLAQVDVGDQIIITMTRALVISMTPAPVGTGQ